jgi:hypothetical protein
VLLTKFVLFRKFVLLTRKNKTGVAEMAEMDETISATPVLRGFAS